ncbi:GNAT family N-acetyltransferase [Endozoicomonas sp. 8E]|uniref:GNAT family N-acetyltransferase n=1 Tax=Endozoicomonas sp. 8E TaxID=3035692 RepID=UPI002939099B|nr:GNAT family N-acetyltransferase [Endozoicomonas sp. 8E]WOG30435.1 GNAT family N-acetyltransferase [Endozoicomonas sp. 8E]
MAQTETITGFGLRLRCVTENDAKEILNLRTDPSLTKFIPALCNDEAKQRSWIERQKSTPHDYYFAIEKLNTSTHPPEGFIGLYNIDCKKKYGEWGRWIVRPRSLAAYESAYLIYQFGFDSLRLNLLYSQTIRENTSVVLFHEKCGCDRVSDVPKRFVVHGRARNVTRHEMTLKKWQQVKENFRSVAAKYSEFILRH